MLFHSENVGDSLADAGWSVTSQILAIKEVDDVPHLLVQGSDSVSDEIRMYRRRGAAHIVELKKARLREALPSSSMVNGRMDSWCAGSSSLT